MSTPNTLARDFSFVSALLVGASLALAACAPEAGKPKGPPTGPFTVSDYFAPSGAMGDGATPGNVAVNESPCRARAPGARGICYSFDYVDTQPYETPVSHSSGVCNWAGLFLQYPTNNWGREPGLPIPAGKLNTVRFSAAVAAGSELVTFQIGGLGTRPGDPAPTGGCPPAEEEPGPYFDQIQNATAPQTVGSEWQEIEIAILPRYPASGSAAEVPITSLLGALAWSVSGTTTPLPKTIYVDDLVYE